MIVLGRGISSRGGAVVLGLVLGGAVGNVADRVFRDGNGFLGGAVVDFIDFQWWPVFNLADAAIVAGALLLAGWSARDERR
jgi:signal peptidase II